MIFNLYRVWLSPLIPVPATFDIIIIIQETAVSAYKVPGKVANIGVHTRLDSSFYYHRHQLAAKVNGLWIPYNCNLLHKYRSSRWCVKKVYEIHIEDAVSSKFWLQPDLQVSVSLSGSIRYVTPIKQLLIFIGWTNHNQTKRPVEWLYGHVRDLVYNVKTDTRAVNNGKTKELWTSLFCGF